MDYLAIAKKAKSEFRKAQADKPQSPERAVDPIEGRIIAVKICSHVLEAEIWFALDDSFNPDDGLAIFYPDELQFLKDKGSQTLRKIHEAKLKLGNGGGRVVQ